MYEIVLVQRKPSKDVRAVTTLPGADGSRNVKSAMGDPFRPEELSSRSVSQMKIIRKPWDTECMSGFVQIDFESVDPLNYQARLANFSGVKVVPKDRAIRLCTV